MVGNILPDATGEIVTLLPVSTARCHRCTRKAAQAMSPRATYLLGIPLGLLLGIRLALRLLSKVAGFCAEWPLPRGLTLPPHCGGTVSLFLTPLAGHSAALAVRSGEMLCSTPLGRASRPLISGSCRTRKETKRWI